MAVVRAASWFIACLVSCSSAARLCATDSGHWGWAMNDRDVIGRFFRTYQATGIGDTPPQPVLPGLTEGEAREGVDTGELSIEMPATEWRARVVGEAPAKVGEYPVRFIDSSIAALPVLCLRPQQGWPIPLLVSELGAVALRL